MKVEEIIRFWHIYSCYRRYGLLLEFNEFGNHSDDYGDIYDVIRKGQLRDFKDVKNGNTNSKNHSEAYKILTRS